MKRRRDHPHPNLYLPKKHVIAFAEKDNTDGEEFEIDSLDTAPRNWVPE